MYLLKLLDTYISNCSPWERNLYTQLQKKRATYVHLL